MLNSSPLLAFRSSAVVLRIKRGAECIHSCIHSSMMHDELPINASMASRIHRMTDALQDKRFSGFRTWRIVAP